MIQTETSKAKLLFISVPNDVFQYRLSTIGARLIYESKSKGIDYSELPKGNWTILNTLDEVTEGEAEKVMSCIKSMSSIRYFNEKGLTKGVLFQSAKTCLTSRAKGLFVKGKTIILYELKN